MFDIELKGKTVKLSDYTDTITKGTTPTTLGFDFVDEGINFVKVESISDSNKFIKKKMKYINEKCNAKLKRSILRENDILFSIAGTIGRTAIVTDEILPANTNQALAIIRLKKNSAIKPTFLNQLLNSPLIIDQYEKLKFGVAQINLSLADIGNLQIIIPTKYKQNKFLSLVEQIDKSKFIVQDY